MLAVGGPVVKTRRVSGSEDIAGDSDELEAFLQGVRQENAGGWRLCTSASTADVSPQTPNVGQAFSLPMQSIRSLNGCSTVSSQPGYAASWGPIDHPGGNGGRLVRSTRATTASSTTISSLRGLLRLRSREELVRKMTPKNRELYERITALREQTGPINFDGVKAIREIRENG